VRIYLQEQAHNCVKEDNDALTWALMALKPRALYSYMLYRKCNANQRLMIGSHEHNGIRSAIKWAYLLAIGGHWRESVLNDNNNKSKFCSRRNWWKT
jgi:hypothetical protein